MLAIKHNAIEMECLQLLLGEYAQGENIRRRSDCWVALCANILIEWIDLLSPTKQWQMLSSKAANVVVVDSDPAFPRQTPSNHSSRISKRLIPHSS